MNSHLDAIGCRPCYESKEQVAYDIEPRSVRPRFGPPFHPVLWKHQEERIRSCAADQEDAIQNTDIPKVIACKIYIYQCHMRQVGKVHSYHILPGPLSFLSNWEPRHPSKWFELISWPRVHQGDYLSSFVCRGWLFWVLGRKSVEYLQQSPEIEFWRLQGWRSDLLRNSVELAVLILPYYILKGSLPSFVIKQTVCPCRRRRPEGPRRFSTTWFSVTPSRALQGSSRTVMSHRA